MMNKTILQTMLKMGWNGVGFVEAKIPPAGSTVLHESLYQTNLTKLVGAMPTKNMTWRWAA